MLVKEDQTVALASSEKPKAESMLVPNVEERPSDEWVTIQSCAGMNSIVIISRPMRRETSSSRPYPLSATTSVTSGERAEFFF